MSNRRVNIIGHLDIFDGRITATVTGLAGEEFETEVFMPYGLSSNPDGGEAILSEINGDPNNHVSSGPISKRFAELGTTLLHYGETDIVLSDESVTVIAGGARFTIKDGCIETNVDIKTTGDVFAGPTSLKNHIHPTPSGPSSKPAV